MNFSVIKRNTEKLLKKTGEIFVNAKNKIASVIKGKRPYDYFCLLLGASIIVFAIVALCGGYEQITSLFFARGNDMGMDFFNSIRDVSHGYKYCYSNANVIYPPLANLLFLMLSKALPPQYVTGSWEDRLSWSAYPSATILYLLFFGIIIAVFLLILPKISSFKKSNKILLAIFLVFNASSVFAIERGNIVFLSNLLTATFILTYNSDSEKLRKSGLICLAIAFNLKLYPAIFGIALIADKRYKDAIFISIFSALIYIASSFFFGGPLFCIGHNLKNIFNFFASAKPHNSEITSGINKHLSDFLSLRTTLGDGAIDKVVTIVIKAFSITPTILFLVALLSALLGSFLIKDRCQTSIMLTVLLLSIPSISSLYLWQMFIGPLILIFQSEKLDKKNIIPFISIILPMLFYPRCRWLSEIALGQTINTLLMSACLFVLVIYQIIVTADASVKFIKRKNLCKKSVNL